MLPGFKSRLVAELNELLQRSPYKEELAIQNLKFHQIPAKENYVAWLGGKCYIYTMHAYSIQSDTGTWESNVKSARSIMIRDRKREILLQFKFYLWLSGAILGDLGILPNRSVSRENYQQNGLIPDWSTIQDAEELDEKSQLHTRK